MAGHFELFSNRDGNCLVRLVDGQGEEVAVSVPFTSSAGALAGSASCRNSGGQVLSPPSMSAHGAASMAGADTDVR